MLGVVCQWGNRQKCLLSWSYILVIHLDFLCVSLLHSVYFTYSRPAFPESPYHPHHLERLSWNNILRTHSSLFLLLSLEQISQTCFRLLFRRAACLPTLHPTGTKDNIGFHTSACQSFENKSSTSRDILEIC